MLRMTASVMRGVGAGSLSATVLSPICFASYARQATMVAHDLGRGRGRPGEQWRAFASRMASYSADIAADLISEPSTGTNLDIAATDHIRPIATTMAIAMDVLRMCIPLCLRRAWRNRARISVSARM
jgi:hypothetical protein